MVQSDKIFEQIYILLKPFNKNGITLAEHSNISVELELSSLDIMDFVSSIEDHFDVTIPLNMLPDLETVADVAALVENQTGD